MQRIFISYAHVDGGQLAELLYRRLQEAGYTVWKDDHNLPLGAPLVKALSDAVESHEHVLLVLSTAAIDSDWVEFETTMAETARRRIIPILIEPLAHEQLPLYLQRRYYLRMAQSDGMALHRLVNHLEGAAIQRVVNLSGQQSLTAKSALILDEAHFQQVELSAPDTVVAYGVDLARFALPYIRQANAGLVLPGLAPVAGVALAYLLGEYNAMPRIFIPHRNDQGVFQIDGMKPLTLQDVRDRGFSQRKQA